MTDAIVTGGAGFIGYHLSKLLLKENYSVTVLDNFSNYYSEKIKRLNASELEKLGATIIEGSILEKKDLLKSIKKQSDIVFHFAAQPGVRYSTLNPEKTLRTNVEGTSNVLSVCRSQKVKKIVVASSSSVFGLQEYLPIDEKHPKNPISYYGVSKLAVEKIIEISQSLNSGIDVSIVRPFTIIGPRQRPDMAINFFVSRALENKPITIFGDGNQTRDWTHVDNIVDATLRIGTNPKARNEDFNIGSGLSTSVNDVLEIISKITDKELDIQYEDFDKADVKDTLAEIKKAKNLLDYEPKKSLEIAIHEFIDDFSKHFS